MNFKLNGNNAVNTMIFLLPVTVVTVNSMASLFLTILAFWGIYLLIKQKINPLKWDKEIQPVLLSFIAVFVVDVLSYIFADYHFHGLGALDGGLRFLLFIPILAVLLHTNATDNALRNGVLVGGILLGILALIQFSFHLGPYNGRAHGSTHPILFGDISLVLAVMNLLYFFEIRLNEKNWNLSHAMGFILAAVAMILSGTRGAWIAMPVLVLFFAYLYRDQTSKKKILFSILLVLLAMVLVYVTPQTGVKNRIEKGVVNLQNYIHSPINSRERSTSVGIRLEIWQAAWHMFVEHPVLGVGTKNYRSEAIKQANMGLRNIAIRGPGLLHAHNDYLSFMAEKGIFGLLAVLSVYLFPFRFFYRTYRANQERVFSKLGMILIIAFSIMSLTEALFTRNASKTFYILMIAILLSFSLKNKINNGMSKSVQAE